MQRANLRGLLLYCGLYDVTEEPTPNFAGIMRMYIGTADFRNDKRYRQFAVTPHVTANFPPFFITVGNADALAGQARRLIDKARSEGVAVRSGRARDRIEIRGSANRAGTRRTLCATASSHDSATRSQ